MSTWITSERECVHRRHNVAGEFYQGTAYLELLQRLPVREAHHISRNVTAFFWSDAPQIVVWLCRDCAAALGFQTHPNASHA